MDLERTRIGRELRAELERGYNVNRISSWAHDLYWYSQEKHSPEVGDILYSLLMMDARPEFRLSKADLEGIVQRLLANDVKR